MRILVLGSSSFAARGLVPLLEKAGHEVWTFNRCSPNPARARHLHGSYDRLVDAVGAMSGCDVLVNYSIAKHGAVEENVRLADHIIAATRKLNPLRFIHISSVSVLPAVRGNVNEDTSAVAHRWKGSYSRVKVAVERHFFEHLDNVPLVVLRPGFILAEGLPDSMAGIGLRLPTGQVLGLGNPNSVVPVVSRECVNEAVARLIQLPLAGKRHCFMLVSPKAPIRAEYLRLHCRELGRGRRTCHLPVWVWRAGLMLASLALTVVKRRQHRLTKLFEHNLNVRSYDCSRTAKALGIEMRFDWRRALRDAAGVSNSPVWPTVGAQGTRVPSVARLHYAGVGRIVQQKHLPALKRQRYAGQISWTDPAIASLPANSLNLERRMALTADTSRVVVTAPVLARVSIFQSLPASVTHLLVEKPFAISRAQLDRFRSVLEGRHVFVVHNYRLKPNVLAFRRFLNEWPSGALKRVTLHYDTPSPFLERSAWMRHEWRNRILLTDYALHYLDLAWLLFAGPMQIRHCDTTRNQRGELRELAVDLSFPQGSCNLFIRQGAHQRQCHLTFVFENYTAHLRFFPDSFLPVLGGHSLLDDLRQFACAGVATVQKAVEKLEWHTFDRSHDQLLAAFTGAASAEILDEFSLDALSSFYERLSQLADAVYEPLPV